LKSLSQYDIVYCDSVLKTLNQNFLNFEQIEHFCQFHKSDCLAVTQRIQVTHCLESVFTLNFWLWNCCQVFYYSEVGNCPDYCSWLYSPRGVLEILST